MEVTISEYYHNKSQNNMYRYKYELQQSIYSRLNKSPTKAECLQLQEFLQGIIYPTTNKQQHFAEKYNNLIKQAFIKRKNKVLQDFNLGNRNYKVSIDQAGAILREKHESFSHKKYIELQTIKQRLEKVKIACQQISGIKELSSLEGQLKSLEKQLEFLSRESFDGHGRLVFANNADLNKRIAEMDAAYQALSVESIVSPKDYGDILEYFLQALNEPVENIASNVTEAMIDKITRTAGQITTGKQGSSVVLDKSYFPKRSKNDSKKITIGTRGATFSFDYQYNFNENADRQGKMDVELKLASMPQLPPFRISAKNWGTLKDLGSTSLAYALIRSIGQEQTLEYSYALTDRTKTAPLKIAHELAKLAIVADIMMGYSQTAQFADTLVINHRAARTVIVQPMKDIFVNLENKLDQLKIKGYKDSTIQKNLLIMSKSGSSQYFNNMSLKYLQSIHVTLLYNSLISI